MEEKKSVKSFIKRHGAEIALGVSCGAACFTCVLIGHRIGVAQTTAKFMKDLCENSGEEIKKELTEEVTDMVADFVDEYIL